MSKKDLFFLSLSQSFYSLTNTWALLPPPSLFLSCPSCLLTLWSSFFLTKQMTRKKPWPPLYFSVPLWRLISVHVHLKQAYCMKQGLGESTKGSVWSLLPSSLLPSHPLAPSMASWISQSFCLQPYLLKCWFPLCHRLCHRHTSRFTALTCLQVTMHLCKFGQVYVCFCFFFEVSKPQSHQMGFPETWSGDVSSHTPRPQINKPDSPT